jgi:uncharacterized membrane protein
MERSNPKTWQAVLTPYRSLSRKGFILVMSLIAAINLAVGGMFYAIGAWPVVGFLGLDVLAIWWAFRVNFADARKAERIVVTEHELILERLSERRGREELRFVRRWVRVDLEEDTERDLIGSLYLSASGRRTAIGAFLPPDERKAFAGQLRRALAMPHI